MIGKIYKITNKVNGKVYIGQTRQSLKERWYKHCQKQCDNHSKMPIKQAIFKYGKENFLMELIEECDVSLLNEQEVYWISKYNSYIKGYNCTIGGQNCATKQCKLTEKQQLEIINKKNLGYSSSQLAKEYSVDKGTITNIFKRHSLKMPHNKNLKESINIIEFVNYLKTENPNLKSIMNKYKICKSSVYNLLKQNKIEYNFSKSAQLHFKF